MAAAEHAEDEEDVDEVGVDDNEMVYSNVFRDSIPHTLTKRKEPRDSFVSSNFSTISKRKRRDRVSNLSLRLNQYRLYDKIKGQRTFVLHEISMNHANLDNYQILKR